MNTHTHTHTHTHVKMHKHMQDIPISYYLSITTNFYSGRGDGQTYIQSSNSPSPCNTTNWKTCACVCMCVRVCVCVCVFGWVVCVCHGCERMTEKLCAVGGPKCVLPCVCVMHTCALSSNSSRWHLNIRRMMLPPFCSTAPGWGAVQLHRQIIKLSSRQIDHE